MSTKVKIDLNKLNEPMPYKWRVQNKMGSQVLCVAYVDSRLVQDRLDEVVGKDNWQDDFKLINSNMYAGIGIREPGTNDWVWKWDCGTESNTEKEKGQASDAFKRAAVKWGIGRFLYAMELQKLNSKKHTNGKDYPTTASGTIIWDGNQLTDYINKLLADSKKVVPASGGVNLRNEDAQNEADKRAARYDDNAGAGKKSYTTTTAWSPELVDEVKKLTRGNKTGSAVLKDFIPVYNEANKTEYTKVTDFKTDAELTALVNLVRATPPTELDV